jgi:hypothetical protein
MSRRRLFAALLVVVPLGVLADRAPFELARNHLSGVLYVVFWILAVLWLRPDWPPGRVAVGVFVATCLVECLQLWHPPWLESIRATWVGRSVLGTTFLWRDFPFYVVGAFAGRSVARRCDTG